MITRLKDWLRWQTKNDLRIRIAYLESRVDSLTDENERQASQITKLEALIDHERARIDAERSRADRACDNLLQREGLLPVTEQGVTTATLQDEESERRFQAQQRMLGQLYAESMDDAESDDEIINSLLQSATEALPKPEVK